MGKRSGPVEKEKTMSRRAILAQASGLCLIGTCLIGLSQAAQAATVVTLEAAGVQAAPLASIGATGGLVETFDAATLGALPSPTTAVTGTYTGGGSVDAANVFGGANSTRFLTSATSGTTLTLATPATYFGMWWSAGSAGNRVELTSGGSVIYALDTADVLSFIALQPTAADYNGNPNGGGNTAEPYVYINFFSDAAFDSVVLSGAAFESDNHAVATSFTSTTGTTIGAVPVPATLPLLASVLGGAGLMLRRRKSARKS